MRQMLALAFTTVSLLAAAACGGSSSSTVDAAATVDAPGGGPPDAGAAADAALPDGGSPDASFNPSLCPETYGPASIINTFAIANSETSAFDLDGDGTGDNSLAVVASLVNSDLAGSLGDGSFRLITELRGLDDATIMNDAALDVVPYSAVDTDAPVVPGDDFSHMEPFYFADSSVNAADCSPKGMIPSSITAGTITGQAESLLLNIAGFGDVTVGNVHFIGTAAAETPATNGWLLTGGRLGGAIPACALALSTDTPLGANKLHALLLLGLQPDIDLDGDGTPIESIQSDSIGIISCTDQDGTVIMGELCACDPRITDGYSALFELTSVGARLLGPTP